MRPIAAVAAFFAMLATLIASGEAVASCDVPTPVLHALDGYFQCADATPVAGFIYQLTDPTATHTGALDVVCEAHADNAACSQGSGAAGDGRVAVFTDWFDAGASGCIAPPDTGPQRVVLFVQGVDGQGLLLSLSGTNPSLAWAVEAAHPYAADTGVISPLSCGLGAGRPVILSESFFEGMVSLSLRLRAPQIVTDCDAGSLGAALGGTCTDGFSPALEFGRIYSRVGPCTTAPNLERGGWTDTGVPPDATGSAALFLTAAPADQCLYVGGTTIIDGTESGGITGFATLQGDSCTDTDQDGVFSCHGDCDDRDPSRFPGNTEICDGVDNNCNGIVDEDDNGYDTDGDGTPNACDTCPTIANPDQDPADCDQSIQPIIISFSSPLGRGSGTVTWTTTHEVNVSAFNVISFDAQGNRTQENPSPIPCEECITGQPHTYMFFVDKHRSGQNVFVELIDRTGAQHLFGPATRQ